MSGPNVVAIGLALALCVVARAVVAALQAYGVLS